MKSCAIASAVFLLACRVAWADAMPEARLDVSYCQLAKDPSAFSGKRVRVRAIYHFGFEIQRLESLTCCQGGYRRIAKHQRRRID
jgi:hypothetical protein